MSCVWWGSGLQMTISQMIRGKKPYPLTHRNNICLGAIHATIVLVRAVQPWLGILLQARVGKLLPCRHKYLECRYHTAENRGALTRHDLLDTVWDLLAQSYQDVSDSPIACLRLTLKTNSTSCITFQSRDEILYLESSLRWGRPRK